MPGQPNFGNTPLIRLRRQQLHDLALAYNIKVKRDGTKNEILPALIAAEEEGIFQGQPVRPEYLAKATISADDPKTDSWLQHRIPSEEMDFRNLQRLAKQHGLNAFQKSADELRRELEELRVL